MEFRDSSMNAPKARSSVVKPVMELQKPDEVEPHIIRIFQGMKSSEIEPSIFDDKKFVKPTRSDLFS